MRLPLWLVIASTLTTALTGCGDEKAAGMAGKNAALSGRAEVTLRMARATESAGDYAGAEKLYQQSVSQSPEALESQLELAEFYKRHHEDQKAVDSLNNALKLQPNNADIERELANTYIGAGEPEKALTVLDKAVATSVRNPLLYNSRGVALDQIGSYSEAQKSYNMAFDIDPAGGNTYKINLSMSYILSGQYGKAIALLRPMLDTPDSPPIARQNLALAYGLKGESENALKLGLEDLSTSEAEENIRFYRMLAQRHNAAHPQKIAKEGSGTVPASVVKELFPEDEPAAAVPAPGPQSAIEVEENDKVAQSAPVKSVTVSDNAIVTKPTAKPLPDLSPASGSMQQPDYSSATAGFALPEPVLKPDRY